MDAAILRADSGGGWTPKTNGYGGTGDWLCRPELYPRYGAWIESFVRRYWEDGKGGLWGLENYNEPWEGGGISGWASDSPRYRELQKLIATSAKKVDPKVRILAASSIMNTEDKLYSDGSNEMDGYIDIFTDHYVPPVGCYGPMVAKAHGKGSMETETWFVNSEYSLPQGVVQFLASGQSRIAPWHPRVLFDSLPGNPDSSRFPRLSRSPPPHLITWPPESHFRKWSLPTIFPSLFNLARMPTRMPWSSCLAD